MATHLNILGLLFQSPVRNFFFACRHAFVKTQSHSWQRRKERGASRLESVKTTLAPLANELRIAGKEKADKFREGVASIARLYADSPGLKMRGVGFC